MKKFLKIFLVSVLAVFWVSGSVSALPWVVSPFSPAGGTTVFGDTNIVGVQEISDPESGTQVKGIYGAGFIASGSGVLFDADLYTWDSYSQTGDPSNNGGNKGWWDVFVININQTDYYWNLVTGGNGSISDPIIDASYTGGYGIYDNSVLPGATFAFGGEDFGNGTLEKYLGAPSSALLQMIGGDPTKPYYVSVILDTNTPPDMDSVYPSWGSFHIDPVPIPAAVWLLGAGLMGLVGIRKKVRS